MPGPQAAGVLRAGQRRAPSPGRADLGRRPQLQGGPSGLSLHTKRLDFYQICRLLKAVRELPLCCLEDLALSTAAMNRRLSRALVSPPSGLDLSGRGGGRTASFSLEPLDKVNVRGHHFSLWLTLTSSRRP